MFQDNNSLLLLILLGAALVVGIMTLIRILHTRVWINTRAKVGAPLMPLGYLDYVSGDGTEAQVHLMGEASIPIGRVKMDDNKDIANVETLTSNLDEEPDRIHFKEIGYISIETDNEGYIYKKTKGGNAQRIGYVARPSAPDVPCLIGERNWRSLWMKSCLNAYMGMPEAKLPDVAKQDTEDTPSEELPKENDDLEPVSPQDTENSPSEELPESTNDSELESIQDSEDESSDEPIENASDSELVSPLDTENKIEESNLDNSNNEIKIDTINAKPKDKKKKPEKGETNAVKKVRQPYAECHFWGPGTYKLGLVPPEARACAYALLYEGKRSKIKEFYQSGTYGWKDTALLTTLIYSLVFLGLYLFNTGMLRLPLLGDDLKAVFILIAFYYLLWVVVRAIKIDRVESGHSFQPQLDLLNKCLALKGMDYVIIVFSILSLYFSFDYYDFDYIPLIWAIGFGVCVNMFLKKNNHRWSVVSNYDLGEREEDDEEKVANPPGDIPKDYEWSLDEKLGSLKKIQGKLTLYFSTPEINVLRHQNPFYQQRKDKASKDYVLEMFNFMKIHKAYSRRVRYIAQYINEIAHKHNMLEVEKVQFALDFVQEPNIQFVANEQSLSTSVNTYKDYIRYPDETLFDKEGDCNSKALLAATLFHAMGYDVLYLFSHKQQHAAIGIELSDKLRPHFSLSRIDSCTVEYNHNGITKSYVFCETTGDGMSLGSVLGNIDLREFDEKILLPYSDEDVEETLDDGIETRTYEWKLDSELGHVLYGTIVLNIDQEALRQLRKLNPFQVYGQPEGDTYERNIENMFAYIHSAPSHMEHIKTIANYISKSVNDANLPSLDLVQFALDFAQEPNIRYVVDQDSSFINYAKEYMRFPDEVLFDKEGDCDCKSSLTAALLQQLGYSVVFLLSTQLQHAAIGVELKEEWLDQIAIEDIDKVVMFHNGKRYIYCETTGDNYRVGKIQEGQSITQFEKIVELPA